MSAKVLLLLCAPPAGWAFQRLARRLAGAEAPLGWWIAGAALAVLPVSLAAQPPVAASLVLSWTLLVLAVIDGLTLRLPDALTLPLAAAGLASSALGHDALIEHAVAGAIAFAALAGLDALYVKLRGRHGMGLGDAKLMAAAGAWLGWRPLPSVLLIACAGGLVWVAVRMLRRGAHTLKSPLPFGVPLCFAIWVAWMTHPYGS